MEHSEVIVITEAHGLPADAETFRRELPQFLAWLSTGDRVGAGGPAILVRRSALRPMPGVAAMDWRSIGARFTEEVGGQAAYVDTAAGRGVVRVVGVHVSSPQLQTQDRKRMLRRLRSLTLPLIEGATVLVGDFNMSHGVDSDVAEGRPDVLRMDSVSQWWSTERRSTTRSFRLRLRRHTVGGEFVGFSTLDRAFVHLGGADLLRVVPTFTPLRDITDRGLPSDHTPMLLRFGTRSPMRERLSIPDHVVAHPHFGDLVKQYFSERDDPEDDPYSGS